MGEPRLWVNGELLRVRSPHLSARDRGLTLGDGLYETVRVHEGRLELWVRHLARLWSGAAQLGLDLGWKDEELQDAARQVLEVNELSEAVLRVTLSRGVSEARGLLPPADARCTLVLDAYPFQGYPEALYAVGMSAVISTVRRNEHSPTSGLKTLSYLDNVLARTEAARAAEDEALLLNASGALACATAANLFLVVEGALLTPDLSSGVLPGVVRAAVLAQLAPDMGMTTLERGVALEELWGAQEVFLTSSLLGVMPLCQVDGRPVGAGSPGPVATRLRAALRALLAETSVAP